MAITVCPSGHRLQVPDDALGQVIRCPSCQSSFMAAAAPNEGYSSDPFAPGGGSGSPTARSRGSKSSNKSQETKLNNFVGKPLLFLGLFIVILGKGCDGLGLRYVARAQALHKQAIMDFENKWADEYTEIDKKIRVYNEKIREEKDFKKQDDLRKKVREFQEDRSELQDEQNDERYEKETDEWKPLRINALNASNGYRMSFYWYKWIDILGTIVLLGGLILVAFTGQGGDRWISLVMIGIITFSLYVVGTGWIDVNAQNLVERNYRPPSPKMENFPPGMKDF